jgi:hypothetical protein
MAKVLIERESQREAEIIKLQKERVHILEKTQLASYESPEPQLDRPHTTRSAKTKTRRHSNVPREVLSEYHILTFVKDELHLASFDDIPKSVLALKKSAGKYEHAKQFT